MQQSSETGGKQQHVWLSANIRMWWAGMWWAGSEAISHAGTLARADVEVLNHEQSWPILGWWTEQRMNHHAGARQQSSKLKQNKERYSEQMLPENRRVCGQLKFTTYLLYSKYYSLIIVN